MNFQRAGVQTLEKGHTNIKRKRNEHKYTNTCTKFQGEIVNAFLVGAPGKYMAFGKEQVLVKNHAQVFFSAEPV